MNIVLELPFIYSTQSSDIFGTGAVKLLEELQIDTLVFGTETDSIEWLKDIADLQLNNKEYDNKVKYYTGLGLNYPTATNKALYDLTGYKVDTPNDLLALSYIKQIKKDNKNIEIINIKRTIDYHTTETDNNITSASNIRNK